MSDLVVQPVQELLVVEASEPSAIVTGSSTGLVISDSEALTAVHVVSVETATSEQIYNVVVEVVKSSTILAGQPGPAGPVGLSEDSVAYARQTDFVGEDVIYKGEAEAGTSVSAPAWRIRKITIVNDDISETWADGNTNFDNVWTNRATLSYS